ncbi:hypothetical protein EON65_49020 [archaeon]|nr:MAG: hypothetical protein EON65_49020 [archaeon]
MVFILYFPSALICRKQPPLGSKGRKQLIMQTAKHTASNELGASSSSSLAAFFTPPFSLQLASSLPSQPFVNHPVPLRLLLVDSQGQIVRGQRISLSIVLVQAGAGAGGAETSSIEHNKNLYVSTLNRVCVW